MAGDAPSSETRAPTADVVVVGSGPAGLAAAIAASDTGASVILVEANTDIGGHGMLSGGAIELGGGHPLQRQLGIDDSPDRIFADWTRPDMVEGRFNDRTLVRRFADESAATFAFLAANGVDFIPETPAVTDRMKRNPMSALRVFTCREWPIAAEVIAPDRGRNGSGLVRALAASARSKGVRIELETRFADLTRNDDGKVSGITVELRGRTASIAARRGVVLATGGSTGDVELRRIFDPRLTAVYQYAGAVYSAQSGDAERAALAIGAALWGTANQTGGAGVTIAKTAHIGCRWGYRPLVIEPHSPIFARAGATGLTVKDWQNVVLVNAAGDRFWDEADNSPDFIDAALAYSAGPELNGGGPVWAIFDAAGVTRESWNPAPPHVDPEGYFFSGATLSELARNIHNPWQPPMDGARLERNIARYNGFVAAGRDSDFGKPAPRHPIMTPSFYAAWATPILHDSLTGLRTDPEANVLDLSGEPIAGLYCAGESQGGMAMHGLARALVFGRIAGSSAARGGTTPTARARQKPAGAPRDP